MRSRERVDACQLHYCSCTQYGIAWNFADTNFHKSFKFLSERNFNTRFLFSWISCSNYTCQENFANRNFHGHWFLQITVRSQKSQNFVSQKNFPLYCIWCTYTCVRCCDRTRAVWTDNIYFSRLKGGFVWTPSNPPWERACTFSSIPHSYLHLCYRA